MGFLVELWQNLDNSSTIPNAHNAIAWQFNHSDATSAIRPGQKVAITAGSRGIDRINTVIRATVWQVKRLGAEPFIITAMGSHGKATPEGQKAVLAELGITEETMGCPIVANMKTEWLGRTPHGVNVHLSEAALEADLVIPVNRIKLHTSFRGRLQSGLAKMIVVGLGNKTGAAEYHSHGYPNFSRNIVEGIELVRQKVRIPFGVALVENGLSKLTIAEIVAGDSIVQRDSELLKLADQLMPRLPGKHIDVLFVGKIGKKISGRGMDPNVTHRGYDGPLPGKPEIGKIIVCDVEDGGNANGIGAADYVLKQAHDKIDGDATIENTDAANTPQGAEVREIVDNSRIALVRACSDLGISEDEARIVFIKNTKDLEKIWVSENFLPQIPKRFTVV